MKKWQKRQGEETSGKACSVGVRFGRWGNAGKGTARRDWVGIVVLRKGSAERVCYGMGGQARTGGFSNGMADVVRNGKKVIG